MSLNPSDSADTPPSFLTAAGSRRPAARLGVAVVHDLVAAVITGQVNPGDLLPSEGDLSAHFGVSRTVIRESIKRIEEKGLLRVAQGRGTTVEPSSSWNLLDPVVLSVLAENDDSLGFLDELAVVRTALEGSMAGLAAANRSELQAMELRSAFLTMERSIDDPEAFQSADAEFHLIVMSMSDNLLAQSITKILFDRARATARFSSNNSESMLRQTLTEHRTILDAVVASDSRVAETAMRDHIANAWSRRRLPTSKRP